MEMSSVDFEEDEDLRSAFIHKIIMQQVDTSTSMAEGHKADFRQIPKKLIRYWHDALGVPDDVRVCLDSWRPLAEEGFEFHMFDDVTAAAYISAVYGERESQAFARCSHPAMRCDYFRMCFVLEEGGLYVDADDVLLGDGWRQIFRDARLKVQPLCYDIAAGGMISAQEIWRSDAKVAGRTFYVNNDPIAAPSHHPVIRRALSGATRKLLDDDRFPEIQSTTGPGNFTVAIASHAHALQRAGAPFDFELLREWHAIAEMRWDLTYRNDSRNWRNVYGC